MYDYRQAQMEHMIEFWIIGLSFFFFFFLFYNKVLDNSTIVAPIENSKKKNYNQRL